MLIRRNFILDLNLPCSRSSIVNPPGIRNQPQQSRAFHPATLYLLIGYFIICVCLVQSLPKTENEEQGSHLFISTVGGTKCGGIKKHLRKLVEKPVSFRPLQFKVSQEISALKSQR